MRKKEILIQAKNIAVIGATQNKNKYGYKIYKKLKEMNKKVYPVSPIYQEIDGEFVYSSISEIKEKIDLAVFVVNTKLSKEYIKDCKEIPTLWFQPNTYDDELLNTLQKNQQNYVLDCVLIASEE